MHEKHLTTCADCGDRGLGVVWHSPLGQLLVLVAIVRERAVHVAKRIHELMYANIQVRKDSIDDLVKEDLTVSQPNLYNVTDGLF